MFAINIFLLLFTFYCFKIIVVNTKELKNSIKTKKLKMKIKNNCDSVSKDI